MKIAVVSNGARSLVNFRGPLMAEMIQRGHEVIAFAPDHDEETRGDLLALGVQPLDFAMLRSGTSLAQEFGSILELQRLFRQHRPDVCFAYFLKPVIYGTIAAWLAGTKRRYGLIAGLGFAFTEGAETGRKRRFLQIAITVLARFAFKRIDQLMFQNPDDLEEFVSRKIVSPGKAVLVGATGVDMEEWSPRPLPEAPITFLLAARLLRDKGVGEYVDAARILRDSHPETRFLLLGGIDNNPAAFTQAEIEHWVAEGLIEWPGHVQVKPWLAQSHVFILPSYYREGVPRSTQEAMAIGRAVVTTDRPGCRETVVEGVNGYLVPARDSKSLAVAMKRFLDNPNLIATMGNESRRLAEVRFDVHRLNARLLAFMGLN